MNNVNKYKSYSTNIKNEMNDIMNKKVIDKISKLRKIQCHKTKANNSHKNNKININDNKIIILNKK